MGAPGQNDTVDKTTKGTLQAEVLTPARSIAALSSSEPMLQFTNENEILQDIRETSEGRDYIQNYLARVATVNRLSSVDDLKMFI